MRAIVAAAITVSALAGNQCAPAPSRQIAPEQSVWIDCAPTVPVAHYDLTGLTPGAEYQLAFGAQPPQIAYATAAGEIHHTLRSGDGTWARRYPTVAAVSQPSTGFDVRTPLTVCDG